MVCLLLVGFVGCVCYVVCIDSVFFNEGDVFWYVVE